MSRLGHKDSDYVDLGYRLLVAEASCTYRQLARYDKMITVRTSLDFLSRRVVVFRYLVMHTGTAATFVEGKKKHLCIDGEGRSRTIPEPYYTHLSQGLSPNGLYG